MVLLLVLHHLLDVQGTCEVALGQMVAKLRNAEQAWVDSHGVSKGEKKSASDHNHVQTR